MRVGMKMGPFLSVALALSAFPAFGRAYPSDSLLLVRIATLGSSGDTLKDREFAYAKDDQGYWYASDSYIRHDSAVSTERKTYDAAGRDVFDTLSSLLPGGKTFRLSTRTEYDGADRPVSAVLRYDDSLKVVYGYQYDASGKVSKWTLASGPIDSSGASISSEYDYAYDAQGRLRTETFLSGGVATQTVAYGYDSAGRVGSRLALKANGDTLYAKTFAYDGEGRLIREISAYGNDTLSLIYVDERTEYDASGNVQAKKQYDKAGYLMTTDAYAYATVHVPVSLAPSRSRRAALRSGFPEGPFRDALGRFLARGSGGAHPGFLAPPDRRRIP